jgi:transposase
MRRASSPPSSHAATAARHSGRLDSLTDTGTELQRHFAICAIASAPPRVRRIPASARVGIARQQVTHIRALTRQADALERELLALIKAHRPQLLAETGCGALTAALLIGRTASAERFRSDASFARQTGTAPIPCSSGQRHRHRLDRGGDRQLNHALHIIAITRARHDPATKAYLARKEAEGKGKKGALRCLKRHLARRFHHLLSLPAQTPQADPSTGVPAHPGAPRPGDISIVSAAPAPMPCIS